MTSDSPQMALPIALSDHAGFDNFWVGQNKQLLDSIKQFVTDGEPPLIYYYGAQSSGKSHLLFACGKLARAEVVSCSYLALSSNYVSPEVIAGTKPDQLVCLDDVHSIAGQADMENAVFTLFEQIKHAHGQLLVSSNRPPDQSGFGLPDLVSRLSSGLVFPLHGLTEDAQYDAVQMRAKQRGISISEDTVRYLLARLPRDTKRLFEVLDTIDQQSLIEKRRITIPFLRQLL